jgi:hypothetical protein
VSLFGSIRTLWSRAPLWRYCGIGAGLATALALFVASSGPGTAPPGSGSAPSPGAGPGPSASGPAPSRSSACLQNQGLHAPLVPAPGGVQPQNVTAVGTPTQPDFGMQARFRRFATIVEAAEQETREGARCEKMDGALAVLESNDYAYAECEPDGTRLLTVARACESDLAASELRFTRMLDAHEQFRQADSAQATAALGAASRALTDFDKSRERWGEISAAREAGNRAEQRIVESDVRIGHLEAAAAAATGGDAAAVERLAAAGRRIGPLERSRLDDAQQGLLELAMAADRRVVDSDRRLANLRSAARVRGDDAGARNDLFEAVSRLQPFDRARAGSEDAALIAQAQADAARHAAEALTQAAAGFDAELSAPAEYERLRDLLALVNQREGARDELPAHVLARASQAEAVLEASDRRIAGLRDSVDLAREEGSPRAGRDVVAALGALTAFDEARMDLQDAQTLAFARQAQTVVQATDRQVLTRDVPLFLSADAGDAVLDHALARLRNMLDAQGFSLVVTEEDSAVSLLLARGEWQSGTVVIGTQRLATIDLQMRLSGNWTYTGAAAFDARVSAQGASSSAEGAARLAAERAIDDLVGRLREETGD